MKTIFLVTLIFMSIFQTNATPVYMVVSSKYSFFGLFKKVYYKFQINSEKSDPTVVQLSDWAFFTDYFENFRDKIYGFYFYPAVNGFGGFETEPDLIELDQPFSNKILFEYDFPGDCANMKDSKMVVEDLGWSKQTIKHFQINCLNEKLHYSNFKSSGKHVSSNRRDIFSKVLPLGKSYDQDIVEKMMGYIINESDVEAQNILAKGKKGESESQVGNSPTKSSEFKLGSKHSQIERIERRLVL